MGVALHPRVYNNTVKGVGALQTPFKGVVEHLCLSSVDKSWYSSLANAIQPEDHQVLQAFPQPYQVY